ncbi:hypothetical protein V565_095430 [Rhizoctonia solani 123E]|uniref:Uncharacterized protein n=1 Tax=Rhizoctonia solani 123E TaxID=1423351 RepID=A0A074RRJ6_9AGAM|nr:hypothetical protein V565_095430 [Rhizoctonia solani 123E]
MAIFESTLYPATANESPVVTPTFCHTARPSSSSSALSITSITPCLTASSDSNSFASFEQIVPAGGFFYTASMNQLDASGYPTRALYYLHKRMLEVVLYPAHYHNQSWCLQIRPGTPIPSPPLSDEEEGMIAPENSLEDDEILNILGTIKQARLMEDDPVLHNLCATLVSTEYVTPPTPPTGATPCGTPPEFEAPVFTAHDEHACRIARMVVSCGVTEWDSRAVEEFEVELECAAEWILDDCPCGQKEEHRMTLLEEMANCGFKTPRETKQARRRARNSSKLALDAIIEAF